MSTSSSTLVLFGSTFIVLLTYRKYCVGAESVSESVDNGPVAVADQVGEYCQLETMRGRCRWKSEVIVMTSARWGRMKIGRCLDVHPKALAALGDDPMFIGCSEDVLTIADKKCSGRSQCDIRIPDSDLDKVTPCYPDQKSYFETTYTCVKVVQDSRSCFATINSEQQFLSSFSASKEVKAGFSCGSPSHPWHLEVPNGQRINISLLDFTSTSHSRNVDDVSCRQYGHIVEKISKTNVTICAAGSEHQRETALYTSASSSVDIVLSAGSSLDNFNFLIKVEAIGCTNMIPPDNAWLKRSNNDVIIGCYLSQQTWQLKCDGHEWKGQVGTCPDEYIRNDNGDHQPEVFENKNNSKMFLAMIVMACGAAIICITVITTGIICLQKCKQAYKKNQYLLTGPAAEHQTSTSNSQFVTTGQQPEMERIEQC